MIKYKLIGLASYSYKDYKIMKDEEFIIKEEDFNYFESMGNIFLRITSIEKFEKNLKKLKKK